MGEGKGHQLVEPPPHRDLQRGWPGDRQATAGCRDQGLCQGKGAVPPPGPSGGICCGEGRTPTSSRNGRTPGDIWCLGTGQRMSQEAEVQVALHLTLSGRWTPLCWWGDLLATMLK